MAFKFPAIPTAVSCALQADEFKQRQVTNLYVPMSSQLVYVVALHVIIIILQMASVMASKGTSFVGSGANMIPHSKSPISIHKSVCTNARLAVVEKQTGADPSLPVCWVIEFLHRL